MENFAAYGRVIHAAASQQPGRHYVGVQFTGPGLEARETSAATKNGLQPDPFQRGHWRIPLPLRRCIFKRANRQAEISGIPGRRRGHARSSTFTGGERYVWINRETNGCSCPARRNDRNTEGERSRHAGLFQLRCSQRPADENAIWVTEVWDGLASHDASLSLPSVKNAMPPAKEIVSSFERIAVTSPVWGVGLPAARAH